MFNLLAKLKAKRARKAAERQHEETLAGFERRIEAARAKHQPVRHIKAERTDYMHAGLRRKA